MRKLASIQKILSLDPIPGADKIEKATILGWEVVTGKSEGHKVGDLVCYIEVDSIVPMRPEFDFLKDRKYRVKTIKLRGQVSQGLIVPLHVLPKGTYAEGQDVTELLGVKKYDPEGEKERRILEEKSSRSKNKIAKFMMQFPWYRRILPFFLPKKASWPKFIKKTDEDRIQLFPNICEKEKDTIFEITEKIDGQSATYFLLKNKNRFLWFGKKYIFGVCSRNLYLPKPNNSSYWTVAKERDVENKLEKIIGDNEYVVLQGEIIGPGIQGNKYEVGGYMFYAFNLIYPDGSCNNSKMLSILRPLDIMTVPIIDFYFRLKNSIPECVEYAKGRSILNDVEREGVVIRNYEKNISFKVINPNFLLKYED